MPSVPQWGDDGWGVSRHLASVRAPGGTVLEIAIDGPTQITIDGAPVWPEGMRAVNCVLQFRLIPDEQEPPPEISPNSGEFTKEFTHEFNGDLEDAP